MGQKKKTFRPITSGYFIFENEVYNSTAFQDIKSVSTMKIFLYFLHKTYRKKTKGSGALYITNDGKIDVTYRQLKEACNIKHNYTIAVALRELIEKFGLIDRLEVGRWDIKSPSIYGLSERWRNYGTDKFESVEMMRIPKALGG